jgi:hypothetical protein
MLSSPKKIITIPNSSLLSHDVPIIGQRHKELDVWKCLVPRVAYALTTSFVEPFDFVGKRVGYIPDQHRHELWIARVVEVHPSGTFARLEVWTPFPLRDRNFMGGHAIHPSIFEEKLPPPVSMFQHFLRQLRLHWQRLFPIAPKSPSSPLTLINSNDSNATLVSFSEAIKLPPKGSPLIKLACLP